ncbi:type II secretion system F family protein [Actinocrispum wychmicini]|uniref:Flp pilus assembly protein TadB n=1 Tax=Actinocrispum wychmicini TaxID=1213861 RepID=A0A4R2IVJ8_9PSEU|nr:type II secretion system F family protein [Actinocrispum wychmicini]TCO49643.1 Flp pilus assembly protein TadB [Actinocrispum wychmicini]
MTLLVLTAVLGAVGVLLVLLAVLPPAPVDLPAVISRIDDVLRQDVTPRGWHRVLQYVVDRSERSTSRWWGIPTADLHLVGQTTTRYLARRGIYAVLGAAVMVAALLRMNVVSLAAPAAVVGAVALSMVPWYSVRHAAGRARRDVVHALAALFDLTAQERDAGRAPGQALTAAAAVCDGWAFSEVRSCLRSAQRTGVTPWAALTQFSARIEVEALHDLGDIIASAADGAAVSRTLRDKAAVLREAALQAESTTASKRSEWLFAPVALLVIGLLVLLLYPIFSQIPQ